MTELVKTYDPAAVESEAYRVWLEERCFHAEPGDAGDPYAIAIPPPNVTAALHLGHALNNTIQDILTRWRRMAGDNAVWLPGTDHAGIATQTVVEKRVLAEEGKRRTDFPRDVFVAKIQAWKDEYEQRITDQLKAMGCSCDWDRQAFTMDPPRARAVREAFFRLFKDGLIYRGKRLVNWDPVTQTALADDEVEMEEVDGFFYYLRYPLTDGTGHITVATTRPETMLGDTAVALNPKDSRAAELRGKLVRLPIVGRKIRIIEDEYVVLANPESDDPKAKYASGFLKVTPAHDPNDWEIGRRHNLAAINVMAPDASISDKHGWTDIGDAGFLLGKSREEARKLIVAWFKDNGLLEGIKPYRHSVGHSYRSHAAIEPYLSDQWYCKVTDQRLAGAALRSMAPDQFDTGQRTPGADQSRDRKGADAATAQEAQELVVHSDGGGAASTIRQRPLPDGRGSDCTTSDAQESPSAHFKEASPAQSAPQTGITNQSRDRKGAEAATGDNDSIDGKVTTAHETQETVVHSDGGGAGLTVRQQPLPHGRGSDCTTSDERDLASVHSKETSTKQSAPQTGVTNQSRDRKGAGTTASATKTVVNLQPGRPLAYFITFTTYGTWLHGKETGSVDRDHNLFGTEYLLGDEVREIKEFDEMAQPSAVLDEARRKVVLETIEEVCCHRGWTLSIAHARTTHVHVVLSADEEPEKILNALKSYSTRRLREAALAGPEERIWTRHGSTRYLWKEESRIAACDYVHDQQGVPLSPGPLVPKSVVHLDRPREAFDSGRSLQTTITNQSRDRKGAEAATAEHASTGERVSTASERDDTVQDVEGEKEESTLQQRPLPYGRGSDYAPSAAGVLPGEYSQGAFPAQPVSQSGITNQSRDRQGADAATGEVPFRGTNRETANEHSEIAQPSEGSAAGDTPQQRPLPHGRGSDWPSLQDGGLRFYPARYAKTFQTWHENLRDWAISRQLWWGHRIPVWSGTIEQYGLDPRLVSDGQTRVVEGHAINGVNVPMFVRDEGGIKKCYLCVPPGHDDIEQELERAFGLCQDPDVLDTWFSSALWPMSTLNWPAETPELHKWNPSDALCTAREIITLWVSRMVMFNLYFRDCLPFKDVFIHAMIQDGEGQKMSKSLGNGVDPLDIIHSHGADAMRYTLAAMTTHTQDLRMPVDMIDPHSGQTFTPTKITNSAGYVVAAPVQTSPADPNKKMVSSYGMASGSAKPTAEMPLAKNTSSKFDGGRNFCNKIWNACRFALSNLQGVAAEPVREEQWSLADRWIVSRFNQTIREANGALREFRFDNYAKACWDFFWRDLCDWYVEAIKPAMKDSSRAPQAANVLASVLDGALRLMHPMIPFVTETIWWPLNEARSQRGLPGRLECPPARRLVKARWPVEGRVDEEASLIFPRLQEIIGSVRNLRNEYNLKPSQKVELTIIAPGDLSRSILAEREMIELLGSAVLKDAQPNAAAPANAVRATAGGCEVFVEGLVDSTAEPQRIARLREDLQKKIKTLSGRLSNESYVAKAPPHLVRQTRDQLIEAETELAKLGG